MMKIQQCIQCRHSYEYYKRWTIIPDCPQCGARGGYEPPPTSDEYYKSMGITVSKPLSDNKNKK